MKMGPLWARFCLPGVFRPRRWTLFDKTRQRFGRRRRPEGVKTAPRRSESILSRSLPAILRRLHTWPRLFEQRWLPASSDENCGNLLARAMSSVYPSRMRFWILHLLIATMLFTSMESVAESVDDGIFHQTHHAHVDDLNQWYPDSDGDEHDSENCEHFCHAHAIALTSHELAPQPSASRYFEVTRSTESRKRYATPPTPPPNI